MSIEWADRTGNAEIVKNLLLIEGHSRSGKTFLATLISAFENTEYFQYMDMLELVPPMVRLGSMNEDAAISFLKHSIDDNFYYRGLGRHLNTRYDDESSIYKSLETAEYLRRSLSPGDETSRQEILEMGRTRSATFILPDTFPHIGLYFKMYPNLRLVKQIRHPIDLVHSWHKVGCGWQHEDYPFSFHMAVKTSSVPVPWYAADWAEEYIKLSDADRNIKSVAHMHKLDQEAFDALTEDQKQKILVIRYENTVEKTHEVMKQVGEFLDKKPLPGMPSVLARQRVPNKLPLEDRGRKHDELKQWASKECYDILMSMVEDYQNKQFNEADEPIGATV